MAVSVSIVAVLLVVAAAYHLVLKPAFFSPLAKIPSAHWSSSVSSLWILLARKQGRENRSLHEAHQRLGPVVRVGPYQLSIDSPDAVKLVYQGGFEKDPWYSVFDNYGVPCMFSARGSKHHSARKRMIANVYSKSYIQSSAAAKAQATAIIYHRLLPLLKDSASPQYKPNGINVHSTFLATTMDFISAYVFGLGSSTNFIQNKGYRDHWLELYNARNDHHFWPQEMPNLTWALQKVGVWLYPRWVDYANEELSAWNMNLCTSAMSFLSACAKPDDDAQEPVVLRALNAGIDKEVATNGSSSILYSTVIQQRRLSVASEVFDHVLAGQETAGIALTYLTWHLSQSQNLKLQHELRQELLTLEPSMAMSDKGPQSLPDDKHLDALPLLDAVIMETLRVHAPIPGAQARRTPYPHSFIGPYHVPGGVRISATAHCLHLDGAAFLEPTRWDHRRWLQSEATPDQLRQRHRQFWAFGSGGRMCIGSNFALHEMKYIVAAIYTNFTTHIVNDRGIEQTDGYTARPASDRLILRFESVTE
ncbi:hypothetical protein S40288_09104 [Stachybotrys chartarum IBT 40288]|nr:hypothetical protein S40288_09104 [Stachybotrys chartarum IBT 40288]